MPKLTEKLPVLICGAGPVGLALSLALSRQGITNWVIEKHPSTSFHPKVRGVNARSIELFRSWNIEKIVVTQEMSLAARRMVWMESIQGNIIGESRVNHNPADSPCNPCLISQDILEKVMLDSLMPYEHAQCFFSTELVHHESHADGITCRLYDRKKETFRTVTCQYLIGADGAHSPLRNKLGIPMTGIENLGESVSVYCHADLTPYLADKPFAVAMLTDPAQRGRFIMAVDLKSRWVIAKRFSPDEAPLDEQSAKDFIRDCSGNPRLEVDVLSISTWKMAALNANSYRKGNVFLAGDAAHRIPPTGGMGMNTGLGDAHNLAWKLAYVIKGYAQEGLLDSYAAERHPLAQKTMDWSTRNAARIRTMFIALEDQDLCAFQKHLQEQNQHLNHPGLDFGYVYRSQAIMAQDDNNAFDEGHYTPELKAGMRFPHCLVQVRGKTISTLDLFEQDFVLLTWDNIGNKSTMPIPSTYPCRVYVIGQDILTTDGSFEQLFKNQGIKSVYVRPDGHIYHME